MGNQQNSTFDSFDQNDNGRSAVCILGNNMSSINGYVHFHQRSPYHVTRVFFELNGSSGEINAIHIHEFGDVRDGCKSLGQHFNPSNQVHGSFLHKTLRHAGDLINNIIFDKNGVFIYEYDDPLISLYGNNSILGRSIVIHEGIDDEGKGIGIYRKESLISGNAGKRIQCGIIGLCKTSYH